MASYKSILRQIRWTPKLFEGIQKWAGLQEMDYSEFVRSAVRREIARLEEEELKQQTSAREMDMLNEALGRKRHAQVS